MVNVAAQFRSTSVLYRDSIISEQYHMSLPVEMMMGLIESTQPTIHVCGIIAVGSNK